MATGPGATALIVYNTSLVSDDLKFNPKDRSEPASIPVMYVTKEAKQKYMNDDAATLDVKLKTEIGERRRTGNNVILNYSGELR